jgi:hypothetical protein
VECDHQIVTAAGEISDTGSLDMKLNDRGMAQRNLGAFRGRFHASKFRYNRDLAHLNITPAEVS